MAKISKRMRRAIMAITLALINFLPAEISPITCCERYPLILLAAEMIIFQQWKIRKPISGATRECQ